VRERSQKKCARTTAANPIATATVYKDDSLSFRSLKKIVASQSACAHRWHIVAISAAAAHNPFLEYMHEAHIERKNPTELRANSYVILELFKIQKFAARNEYYEWSLSESNKFMKLSCFANRIKFIMRFPRFM
jgi:hypothetical protein